MASGAKYPKIDPKNFHYHSDGTGRDTYVKRSNGGLLSQKMLQDLKFQPQPQHSPLIFPITSPRESRKLRNLPPQSHNRITHYYGDGKGRDNHVIVTDGGQVNLNHWRSGVEFFFKDNLRNYTEGWDIHPRLPNSNKKPNGLAQRQQKLCRMLSNPKITLPTPDALEGEYKSWQDQRYQSKSRINFIKV